MNPPFRPPNRDFIGKPAPPGYVAGIGRGATGFTTRSDIGPAREATGRGAGPSRGADAGPSRRGADNDDNEDEYLNESNYDEFAGYRGSLVSKDPYDKDDEEADKTYEGIDERMAERGKALQEAKKRRRLEEHRQERPKIQQQFLDLKQGLKEVSEAEWMSIPEVGDARNRKQRVARADKFTPVPDSLLALQARLAGGGEKVVYIDPNALDQDDGDEDEGRAVDQDAVQDDMYGQGSSIAEMSESRGLNMASRLSGSSRDNSQGNQRVTADPQDYLTNLNAKVPNRMIDERTRKEYQSYFAKLRKSSPNIPNAWIASVRLEEGAGKLKSARDLISKACKECPKSADIWCEALRLHPPDVRGAIMHSALRELPHSEKLWIKAADLESDEEAKRRVFAKARKVAPKSALLWKKSVELEPPQPARQILQEAVECCPQDVDLWLALARLQEYEQAQATLIRASELHPTERRIWLAAAKLQEAAGNKQLVGAVIKMAIEKISASGLEIKRDEWLREAMDADRARYRLTCHEIIRSILGWNMNDMDEEAKLARWLDDARQFVSGASLDCARGVFLAIVSDPKYQKRESVWLAYADFELQTTSAKGITPDESKVNEKLEAVLRRAIRADNCPKSETLWLRLAAAVDERANDLDETRQIFADALEANPDSEKIIIAAVELECKNGNHQEARRILADACKSAKTAQLILRAAKLEQSLGDLNAAVSLLERGAANYKNQADWYLMLGQIEEGRNNWAGARKHYASGLTYCPSSVDLWISLALLEEKTVSVHRARSKLELARQRNPKVARLWLEAARLEVRAGNNRRALTILEEGGRKVTSGAEILAAEREQLNGKRKSAIMS